jgi:hypothetical protein
VPPLPSYASALDKRKPFEYIKEELIVLYFLISVSLLLYEKENHSMSREKSPTLFPQRFAFAGDYLPEGNAWISPLSHTDGSSS